MELWIRLQDKERLVKVYDVYIEGCLIKANFQGHYSGCNYIDLGEYESKERALEVLEDIQKFIINDFKEENLDYELADLFLKAKILELMVRVYEMPKD